MDQASKHRINMECDQQRLTTIAAILREIGESCETVELFIRFVQPDGPREVEYVHADAVSMVCFTTSVYENQLVELAPELDGSFRVRKRFAPQTVRMQPCTNSGEPCLDFSQGSYERVISRYPHENIQLHRNKQDGGDAQS
jgi:hypothetical protein